jgi:hypothetical protein
MAGLEYKRNLEKAREAAMNRRSKFAVPEASEQVDRVEQGLMRPKARPEPAVAAGGMAGGIGLAMMENIQDSKEQALKDKRKKQAEAFEAERAASDFGTIEGLEGFSQKLMMAESGGDTGIQITLDDGRTMTGAFQFGDARLTDYKKATGSNFTTEEFRLSSELQNEVFSWHLADIDKAIDALPNSASYSRDGLRAVAHLGGKKGLRKYVTSKGAYNPSDKFGTTLSTYYNKFSK